MDGFRFRIVLMQLTVPVSCKLRLWKYGHVQTIDERKYVRFPVGHYIKKVRMRLSFENCDKSDIGIFMSYPMHVRFMS